MEKCAIRERTGRGRSSCREFVKPGVLAVWDIGNTDLCRMYCDMKRGAFICTEYQVFRHDTKKREKRRENKYNVNERQAQAKFKKAEPGAV